MAEPDHEIEAAAIRRAAYRRMTPGQKWAQAVMLRRTAWNIKCAGVRMRYPGWSDAQIEEKVREIFLYARS